MPEETLSLSQFIDKRQTALEQVRLPMEAHVQDIADHVMPLREDMQGYERVATGMKGLQIYDGTATGAHELFTDGMFGNIMGPGTEWMACTLSSARLRDLLKVREVKEYLEDLTQAFYEALQRSNFYQEAWNWIWEGSGVGTGVLAFDEDIATGKIVCENIPWSQLYIEENKFGDIDVLHRKWKLTARQAVEKFGKEKVSDSIQRAYNDNPFSTFEFIRAVYPRSDRDISKKNAKNKKFASVWKEKGIDKICLESGMDVFRFATWRYMKDGWGPYGFSPASLCLADILGLDKFAKTMRQAAQQAVEPPLNVPADLRGKGASLKPNAFNYYSNPDQIVRPIDLGKNYQIGIDAMERVQKIIEERYHVNFFLMLSRNSDRTKTAREVIDLKSEQVAVLGGTVGRLNRVLDDALDIVFDIEDKAGRLPYPPDILIEYAQGERIDYQYMGPLAQAQRTLYKQRGLIQALDTSLPTAITQSAQEALDTVVNWEEVYREIFDSTGSPARIIRDEAEVAKLKEGKRQAQLAMEQEQAMQQGMGNMKVAADADKATGGKLMEALKGMTGGLQGA